MCGVGHLAPGWMEPQERQQGQGPRPEGFPALPSTPRQACTNWTHEVAARYGVALGHGSRWTAPCTPVVGSHPPLPWEHWRPSPRGPLLGRGCLKGSVHGWAGREQGRRGFGENLRPGCWAPAAACFPAPFKHLALSLSRNKIAKKKCRKQSCFCYCLNGKPLLHL